MQCPCPGGYTVKARVRARARIRAGLCLGQGLGIGIGGGISVSILRGVDDTPTDILDIPHPIATSIQIPV